MLYTLPEYYPMFSCIAGECEDTCCSGWQIVIDEQSLKKYRSVKGPYRRRLLFSIDPLQKVFRRKSDGSCSHLREDGLCELYRQVGPASLCKTCRLFPRHVEEFENVREVTLSLSCPEAARLILSRPEKVKFKTFEREGAEEEYEDFDELFYDQLLETRGMIIEKAQDRELSVLQRMASIHMCAEKLQEDYDEGRIFSMPDTAYSVLEENRTDLPSDAEVYRYMKRVHKLLGRMEFLKKDWPMWLVETGDILYSDGKTWKAISREYAEWEKSIDIDMNIVWEQILVNFIMGEYCGAVYDGEILAGCDVCLVHTMMLREMMKVVWMRNGKTAEISDLVDMCVRYTRELEHSQTNQKKLQRGIKKLNSLN